MSSGEGKTVCVTGASGYIASCIVKNLLLRCYTVKASMILGRQNTYLHDLYPDFQLPEKCADDKPYVPTYQVSKEKAESLGIVFVPLEVSIKETVESLKDKGFIRF